MLYPDPEWLRIFTDGSLLSDNPNGGAGVFSEIFSFYVPVGRGTAFDGEIAAIRTALSQLQCHLEKFTRAVILCDSRAALLAIVSDSNPKTQDILDCRYRLKNLALLEKTIVLQWVPAHCGAEKRLLIFCKHSYILEVDIPRMTVFDDINFRTSYFIDQRDCQVYKINSLLQFHELGDEISDIEEDESSEAGKEVLRKLKYQEKKKTTAKSEQFILPLEKREARERDLGFSETSISPKILCCLPSSIPGRIWLSFSRNDSGYIFEFEFVKEFQNEPIEFTPVRAVEILSADYVPILSMCFSVCGNVLYMGLQNGLLHYCHLKESFDPTSGDKFEILEDVRAQLMKH
ncbi:uncharacterized protein CDAR_476771 [Caerostris darwini]|uniref:RNase H type-1 domain-containing protein n=1 Tax=Caerostris darwini TaxID=1538125 RepID=A0AAV4TZK3_9ARAC|nr:uncharacterized protein CDAR_476771 [Caerostris darwini]